VPSSPEVLRPQHFTAPPVIKAQVRSPPAASASTPVRPLTCTGVGRSVVELSPNCPPAFAPQQCTAPVPLAIVQVCARPAAMPVASPTLTVTGTGDEAFKAGATGTPALPN
jgi:hypothetical protein